MGFPCCGRRSHSERLSRCPRSWRCGLLRPQDRVTGRRGAWTILSWPSRIRSCWSRDAGNVSALERGRRPAVSFGPSRPVGGAGGLAGSGPGGLVGRARRGRPPAALRRAAPVVCRLRLGAAGRAAHGGLIRLQSGRVVRAALGCAARHPRHWHPLPDRCPVQGDRVLNIAVHELLHPPWPPGHPVKDSLDALAGDPFLAARFARRNPVAGYNTRDRYAEEDAAQALDQFLNTRLGRNSRGDPATRWTTADGGMHVLARLLYDTLQSGGFRPQGRQLRRFPRPRTLGPTHLARRSQRQVPRTTRPVSPIGCGPIGQRDEWVSQCRWKCGCPPPNPP